MDIFTRLFDTTGFIPRRSCGDWTPQLMAMHRVSDLMIWAAYLAIPLVLITIAFRRRRDIPFRGMFVLFGSFIVACGTSHLMEYIMFDQPLYRLAGVVKLFTAIVSWATVFALVPVVPLALAMRSPDELEEEIQARTVELQEANTVKDELLRREQAARQEAEAAVKQAQMARVQAEEARQMAESARAEAEEARRQSERANRAKDEFLNTLSHELRTPLNSILGWSSLLRAGVLDSSTAEQAMESIERNTQTQAQLVEDLLDVSRITEGKLFLQREPLDFAAIVQVAVNSALPSATVKKLDIAATGSSGNCWVEGDSTRLQQVVWNLLSNAIKFTPQGGRIEVLLRCENEHVVLQVRDNGQGIEPEVLPHIWERFRQADSSTTRAHGGLGLGLAIVRSLVELHGGKVAAWSEGEGKGATFTVELPAGSQQPVPLNPTPATLRGQILMNGATAASIVKNQRTDLTAVREVTENPLRDQRILVVDDEPDTRNLIAMVLEQQGAQVKTADSGTQALELARDWQPQAMVSDIGMPYMDGYQLMQTLREEREETIWPSLALTAYAAGEDREKALAAGFQNHLSKPVEPEHLVQAIRDLLTPPA
jgi:signal transduction histidine kinase